MKLIELQPQFLRYERGVDDVVHMVHVDAIEQAQGITFLCPKCFAANGGTRGTHGVICWSRARGTPDDALPGPGRWKLDGTGYHDLSLNADPPATARSVLLTGGCGWHGYVTAGEVTDA